MAPIYWIVDMGFCMNRRHCRPRFKPLYLELWIAQPITFQPDKVTTLLLGMI